MTNQLLVKTNIKYEIYNMQYENNYISVGQTNNQVRFYENLLQTSFYRVTTNVYQLGFYFYLASNVTFAARRVRPTADCLLRWPTFAGARG